MRDISNYARSDHVSKILKWLTSLLLCSKSKHTFNRQNHSLKKHSTTLFFFFLKIMFKNVKQDIKLILNDKRYVFGC